MRLTKLGKKLNSPWAGAWLVWMKIKQCMWKYMSRKLVLRALQKCTLFSFPDFQRTKTKPLSSWRRTVLTAFFQHLPHRRRPSPVIFIMCGGRGWTPCLFSSIHVNSPLQRNCSVYSFSRSCPKTVMKTREVFPTGSTTLLRLQLWRTRDCAHGVTPVTACCDIFLYCFLVRKVPAQSKLKEQPCSTWPWPCEPGLTI